MQSKNLSALDWHLRFIQQAQWTKSIRQQLLLNLNLPKDCKIMEIGCGTGAILQETSSYINKAVYGLDINHNFLKIANQTFALRLTEADVYSIPIANDSFDIIFCHYFLLWLTDPLSALKEMKRVLKQNGVIFIFAEPYYAGRIDFPIDLQTIGELQRKALYDQGANPDIGPSLGHLLNMAGFKDIQTGLLGGQWQKMENMSNFENEWKIIESDLKNSFDRNKIQNMKLLDKAAWEDGERVLFVPTFYSWARK